MNYYQFIISRLNGDEIEKKFEYYLSLVKKGIAGFIVFGGKLETVKHGIRELQEAAKKPLIIASDLEQGLGQQIEGGTLFPPAMAIASAIKKMQDAGCKMQVGAELALPLLRKTFKAIAIEARYAGINTIFAPVLDVNTNPKNPIISTRAFGEDTETVSFFGCEMIKILQSNGIAACGKHFPGHGDTEIDSHISLPVIKKDLKSLEKTEIMPFKSAIGAGVKMIMLGHLKVPALDKSEIPVSLSEKAIKYLRGKMKFNGVIITDALNMGGIGKYSEEEASCIALRAGVDLLLHPTDPDRVVSYLEKRLSAISFQRSGNKLFRKRIKDFAAPDFKKHRRLSEELTKKAIKVSGEIKIKGSLYLIILGDDKDDKGIVLAERLKERFSDLKIQIVKKDLHSQKIILPINVSVVVAIFSSIKAWKGGPSNWLINAMKKLEKRANVFISFGSPYILDSIKDDITKIYAYWGSESAQKAVAEVF